MRDSMIELLEYILKLGLKIDPTNRKYLIEVVVSLIDIAYFYYILKFYKYKIPMSFRAIIVTISSLLYSLDK